MGSVGFEIKNQIYETVILCLAFLKKINWLTAAPILIALGYFFFRKWEFKRLFSFSYSMLLLLLVYVRLEDLFLRSFAPDAADLGVNILRIVAAFIAGAVFLYHNSVVQ